MDYIKMYIHAVYSLYMKEAAAAAAAVSEARHQIWLCLTPLFATSCLAVYLLRTFA